MGCQVSGFTVQALVRPCLDGARNKLCVPDAYRRLPTVIGGGKHSLRGIALVLLLEVSNLAATLHGVASTAVCKLVPTPAVEARENP